MATQPRFNIVDIEKFLIAAEPGLSGLSKESPEDFIASTMEKECDRLNDFFWSVVFMADKILNTGIVPNMVPESCYFGPPSAKPKSKLRLWDEYFKKAFDRRGSKELRKHPGFHWNLVIPQAGHSAAIELEADVYLPYNNDKPIQFNLSFEVNHDDTLTAFRWLLNEWRRPIGQLLRGLPNVELWGNGTTIHGPKNSLSKDPILLLEHHLNQPKSSDLTPNLFSLRSSFGAEDKNEDIVITCAVFLSLFDAIYRLTCDRVDPDRLLKHYQTLLHHIPKAAFRATTIFPKNVT